MPEIILNNGEVASFLEEDIRSLIELGKKINNQDPRGTQFPMFVIKQKVKVYGEQGCCSEHERREDYDGDVCEDCQKLLDNDEELPDECWKCDDECFVNFNWEDQTVEDCGSFFTAEAAKEHIRLNDYHYNKPFVYAIASWRNYELQKVLEILSRLGTGNEAISTYGGKWSEENITKLKNIFSSN